MNKVLFSLTACLISLSLAIFLIPSDNIFLSYLALTFLILSAVFGSIAIRNTKLFEQSINYNNNTISEKVVIKKISLTDEQSRFVSKKSITAFFLGPLYFMINGVPAEELNQFNPFYEDFYNFRSMNFGRRIVWEKRAWKNFAQYKTRQIILDTSGLILLCIFVFFIFYLIIIGIFKV